MKTLPTKHLVDQYRTKFNEILELLNQYNDPRLKNYSERISKSSDETILKQITEFEERLEDNYKKIFQIILYDMSLIFKAKMLLQHAFNQRHPNTNDFSMNFFNKIPIKLEEDTSESALSPIETNEFPKEKTRVFEIEVKLPKDETSYQATLSELDQEKTRLFILETSDLYKDKSEEIDLNFEEEFTSVQQKDKPEID